MQALVYKSTGSWYQVKAEGNPTMLSARIKGKLKIDGITSTNPVAVGDWVEIEPEEGSENYIISAVSPRNNYVNRTSPQNRNAHHIVAANLDQSVLFATLKDPKTSLGFIDRFLVTCEAYHIPAIIVYNKADIYNEKILQKFEEIRKLYEGIGYKTLLVSVQEKKGLNELKQLLTGKITLLSGHSGVGKSSLINYLFPELALKTQNVSDWSGKGMHTTTFAEMHELPFGGKVIDTPGIRELGLVDISKEELSHYFPEMRERLNDCKFNNCLHENEPGCAIKQAVANGEISEERFISYLSIKESITDKTY